MHPFWKLKPASYYCPKGEQMLNGGFEDDTTNWTFVSPAVIDTVSVHSGLKAAKVMARSGSIKQMFATPILLACIASFNIWQRVWETFDWTTFLLQMFYSDGNSWIFQDFFRQKDLLWHQFDLLPYAQAHPFNGILSGFKLTASSLIGMHFSIDDVSLIGSGLHG